MNLSQHDRDTLRVLGEKIVEIAALPVQGQTRESWRRMNQLDAVKPMICIYQIPWDEMNVDNELTLYCEDSFCRQIEEGLRKRVYQWNHMRADMVIEPIIDLEPVLHGDNYGITANERSIQSAPGSSLPSRAFIPQIMSEDDIEKIVIPKITYDERATKEQKEALEDIFAGLLEIRIGVGFTMYNLNPWDHLIMWTGIKEALTDLALRPDYVHKLMDHLTTAYEAKLDQLASYNLLKLNNDHTLVGQGGYGYTDELPGDDFDPEHVGYHNMWGGAMAQIFSEVSPAMHEEFAMNYEIRCLKRFGLNYYGCCEPLHLKVDMSRKIPNLRKISMSPWVDVDKGAEAVGDTLVYSCKPSPAYLAVHAWKPETVRKELQNILEITHSNGCHVELVLKDISTVLHQPQRLWEWSEIVSEVAEGFAR